MHGIASADPGRTVDWSLASADHARHRPGPPPAFFDRLAALGVGRKGQRILDLATGTGLLAREFARRGAAERGLARKAMFWFHAPIRSTAESWRGRMRACRGVGAALAADRVAAFDVEHAALLARIAPPALDIVHRLDAHIFEIG